MPKFGPVTRLELIGYLKQLGFTGPTKGGKHQHMKKDEFTITIPNPHKRDIGKELLARILRQAGISREEWEEL